MRLIFLCGAALALLAPYLTDHIVGGVDAKWYGYVVADAARQIAVGHHYPLVGAGPWAWNGAVHPFRSAPMLMVITGAWNLVTMDRLTPFGLTHLALLTSALMGTLGFYLAAGRLLPDRRWFALLVALLYAGTPAWLSLPVYADAYMSYVAFGFMPIALYGNAQALLRGNRRSYLTLAVGLSLLWMTHPPIALLTTLVSVVIQTLGLVSAPRIPWSSLAFAGAAFVVLSAFYFVGMSEIAPAGPHSGRGDLLQLVALSAFTLCLGRFRGRRSRLGWAAAAVGFGLVIAWYGRAWGAWTCSAGILALLGLAALERLRPGADERATVGILAVSFACGSAVALRWAGRAAEAYNAKGEEFLKLNAAQFLDFFRPLHAPLAGQQTFQPGYGLELAALLLVGIAVVRGGRAPVAFCAAILALVVCFFEVPGISDLWIGYLPSAVIGTAGLPLPLRTVPVLAGFAAMGVVVSWRQIERPSHRVERLVGLLLAAAVVWTGIQAGAFAKHGRMVTGTDRAAAEALRPENVRLGRYAYDLLTMPRYGSDSIVDPKLECRLLDESGMTEAGGADLAAESMEGLSARRIRLTSRLIPASTTWLEIEPAITVEPGQSLLLRFDFDRARNYSGWLVVRSEHGYREYHLPTSGLEGGLGIGGTHSSTISLWNTGAAAEHYQMSLSREPGNDLDEKGGAFAAVTVSTLDSARLPVRVESFDPLTIETDWPRAARLETPRAFVPGYRATVDGRAVGVERSAQSLVSVPLPPGRHRVVVRFDGTRRLWAAGLASAAGWAALGFYLLLPLRDLLQHRLVRFAVVGGTVTVFFMTMNAVLTRLLGLGTMAAFCAAYPFALGLHFTLNKFWTFGRRESTSGRQVIEYLIAAAITFLIQFPSFLLLQRLGLPNWMAAGGANVIQMGVSYLLLRARVFKGGGADTQDLTT